MPKKCEVLANRLSLVVGKGSIVIVEDRQYEIAKQFLKPLVEPKPQVKEETLEEDKPLEEKEVKSKKTKKQ